MAFAARATPDSVPIVPLSADGLPTWTAAAPPGAAEWVRATGFAAKPGEVCFLPDGGGRLSRVLAGVAAGGSMWDLAGLPGRLPEGVYRLDAERAPEAATLAALGWALGGYAFDRYTAKARPKAALAWPDGADRAEVERLAAAAALVRDLINAPACDLGPAELAEAARATVEPFGARVETIVGDALLERGYPSVHAVGRAAAQPPRLVDISWGEPDAPRVTLVGKGVCFDSGGLDIKPASGMLHMKKDMGGAAQVLGLARVLMDAGAPIRLRVLVPAVENAISAGAFRPRDVLNTRKGLTVEVGNTDAEGRLILSDALAEAARDRPEAIVDFATLTGAARVALGTELPALFCNDDALAGGLLDGGAAVEDPLWRLPLWPGYRRHIESKVADLHSTGSVPQGGAITAALFLERFVEPDIPWAHIDLMAYNAEARPGRPEGGEAQGMRAVRAWLRARYG